MNTPKIPLLILLAAATIALPLNAAEVGFEKKSAKVAQKILSRSDTLAIAGFRVAFNLEGAASASTDSRLANLGNTVGSGSKTVTSDVTVRMKVLLGGLTGDDFQAIAEAAYQDFRQKAAASGYNVLSTEAVKATKGYGQLKFTESTKDKPFSKDMSIGDGKTIVVYSPAELPLFLGHYDAGAISGVSMDLNNWRSLNQLSVDTKAVVIIPTIVVDFVEMSSSGQRKMLRNDAEVGAEPELSLTPNHTKVAVFHAKIRIAGELGGLQLDDKFIQDGAFGTIQDLSSSNNANLNSALVRLTGNPGTVRSKSVKSLDADPAAYRKLTLEAIGAFSQAATAQMKK